MHMPFGGLLRECVYVPGDLYSVNQTTAENIDGLLARNERDAEHRRDRLSGAYRQEQSASRDCQSGSGMPG